MGIPFVTNHWCSLEVSNVAFEYNLGWNANLPKGGFGLSMMVRENSLRGMLAKALYDAAGHNMSPQLWIIDNNTPWLRNTDQDIHAIYYDCEDAYVEAAWEDTRSDTTTQARWGLAREFIEDLISLGPTRLFLPLPWTHEPLGKLRVLVRYERVCRKGLC